MASSPKGRLELTWTNKDQRLLAHEDDSYEWCDPADYRVAEVRLLHTEASIGATKPDSQRAQDNLLIRGDALHALTSLADLPEFAGEYVGKVKLCYIDPPFNTGQAFDQYDDALEHSVWLTMMRDRLHQISRLLADDGTVWVHLDDAEAHRARVVLDEVLGADNFVATVIWEKADSPRSDVKHFSTDHDYIHVYAKSKVKWSPNRLGRTAEMDAIYTSADGDPEPWFDDNPTAPGARTHQGMVYAIQSPFTGALQYPGVGRCWFAEQDRLLAALMGWASYEKVDIEDAAKRATVCGVEPDGVRPGVKALMLAVPLEEAQATAKERYEAGNWPEIIFRSQGQGGIGRKRYRPETGAAPRTFWPNSEVGHNRTAKAEIKALFPGAVPFATPKPERLLQRILHVATEPGDIVLDCFAGSGTTAAVAEKMGRRWVTVEQQDDTVATFTLPRLSAVVSGKDLGGISVEERTLASDIPGIAADAPKAAAKTIVALYEATQLGGLPELDGDLVSKLAKVLRGLSKTTRETLWVGGGGFRLLDVAPSMFAADEGRVVLADWATGGALGEATAAELGYEFIEDAPFCGRKGNVRLAVVDGLVNEGVVRLLVGALPAGERVVVAGTALDPAARAVLKELRPGSTMRKVPSSILEEYRAARRRRFSGGEEVLDWDQTIALLDGGE